jgi:predicted transcriptional regulator
LLKPEILQQDHPNQLLTRRRDEIEIVRDILYIAQTGARKTRILYLANLNTATLERYLSQLRRVRLLDHDPNENVYRITPKGKQFMEKYEQCRKYKEMHETSMLDLLTLLRGEDALLKAS